MADGMFNISRGAVRHLMTDTYADSGIIGGLNPANSRVTVVIFEVIETDDTLNNYNELEALIAGSNTEWTSGQYTRTERDDTAVTVTIDDGANDANAALDADITFTTVTGNAAVKLVTVYDADQSGGDDGDIIPMTHHEWAVTPNGGNITADFDPTNGWWEST